MHLCAESKYGNENLNFEHILNNFEEEEEKKKLICHLDSTSSGNGGGGHTYIHSYVVICKQGPTDPTLNMDIFNVN